MLASSKERGVKKSNLKPPSFEVISLVIETRHSVG